MGGHWCSVPIAQRMCLPHVERATVPIPTIMNIANVDRANTPFMHVIVSLLLPHQAVMFDIDFIAARDIIVEQNHMQLSTWYAWSLASVQIPEGDAFRFFIF